MAAEETATGGGGGGGGGGGVDGASVMSSGSGAAFFGVGGPPKSALRLDLKALRSGALSSAFAGGGFSTFPDGPTTAPAPTTMEESLVTVFFSALPPWIACNKAALLDAMSAPCLDSQRTEKRRPRPVAANLRRTTQDNAPRLTHPTTRSLLIL